MHGDLVLINGKVITVDPACPAATAVGMRAGRIVAVGTDAEVIAATGAGIEQIDLKGRTATPGLNDAHAHPMYVGFALADLKLSSPPNRSVRDLVELVAAAGREKPPGTWVVGRGYDQARLTEQRHPTRHDLDVVSPDHPVILLRACHHIGVANSLALQLAGVTSSSVDPEGGAFDRDAHGEPTGVLRETALELVRAIEPEPTESDIANAIRLAGDAFLRVGVTSVAEAVVNKKEHLRAYQQLHRSGDLRLRTYLLMIIADTLDEMIELGIRTGFGDERLRIGPAKLFADGSIGGHTARLRKSYIGADTVGLWMQPPEEMKALVKKAHKAGFQLGIHAIGDAAIELIIDAYDEAQQEFPRDDPRHRIEHCSIVDEALLARIAKANYIPIPGTSFLYYFRDAYVQNLGLERLRYTYGMASYLRHGIIAAASTDAPVVSELATIGLQTMLTRLDQDGESVWPEETIGLNDAIQAYTLNGAYASFEEGIKGSLTPGKLGDVTVFETDLRAVVPAQIGQVEVDFTIMDGEVQYERKGA